MHLRVPYEKAAELWGRQNGARELLTEPARVERPNEWRRVALELLVECETVALGGGGWDQRQLCEEFKGTSQLGWHGEHEGCRLRPKGTGHHQPVALREECV